MQQQRTTCVMAWAACAAWASAGFEVRLADANPPESLTPINAVRYFPIADPDADVPGDAHGDAGHADADRQTGRRVRIRGTVTWISKDVREGYYLVIQDETDGIWVNRRLAEERGIWKGDAEAWLDIQIGMSVEVDGVQDLEGGYAPMIIPVAVQLVSREVQIPKAEPASLDRLFGGSDAGRRIEIDGIVQGFRDAGNRWILVMATGGRRFLVAVPRVAIQGGPDPLVDGRLRVRGVASSRFTTRGEFVEPTIRVTGEADIEVLEPPPSPPFDAPLLPLNRLSGFGAEPPSAHRVRTRGVVTYAIPGEFFYLQQGAVGVRMETQSPELFAPGDELEVAGFIDRSRVVAGAAQAAGVSEAVVRRIGSGMPPVPLAIEPDAIVAANMEARRNGLLARPGDYEGCLVSFPARLVEVRQAITGGMLLLSSGKSTLTAALSPGAFETLRTLEPGSMLEVAGVVQADLKPVSGTRPIWLLPAVERLDLLVRSPEDVRVLGRPSWWTAPRLAAALAATAGVLAAALAWVWLLRRRVAATAAHLAAETQTRRESAIEFNATIRERNRLAANLHDTLLQTMSAIGMQLQSCELSTRHGGPATVNHLGLARRMVDHAVGELRESVWALRSFPLKGQSFPDAVAALATHLADGQTVRVTSRTTGPATDVADFVAGNLLLLIQEAIRNAIHHADAKTIEVVVAFDADQNLIDVTVRDDGAGFTPGTQVGPLQGHFGLQGMRERAERLGGTLSVESTSGQGTTIHARVHNLSADAEPDGGG